MKTDAQKIDFEKNGETPLTDAFAERLLAWHRVHGRHDLPWQRPRTPYRVWVAEVMLQQTQVKTVIPYFERFMAAFVDVEALAAADTDAVLSLWAGLGYYARGRNLHKAAQQIVAQGGFPETLEGWQALPGVGRSTGAAIMAQAFGMRAPILDGNVRRVLCRLFGIEGWPGEKFIEAQLWALAERLLPDKSDVMPDYTQAQMDLGATVCTRSRPHCEACPFQQQCVAYLQQRVSELPTPRPKKAMPVRQANWQVNLAEGYVWLVKNPNQGLWGGLWILPEGTQGRSLTPFRHTFTHFHLDITPYLWHTHLDDLPQGAGQWVPLKQALNANIPAAVKRVLQEVNEYEQNG